MSILQKLREDEKARGAFQDVLDNLRRLSQPEVSDATVLTDLAFDSYLDLLIDLKRKTVQEGQTKIGHWCSRESEKLVKTMKGWPLYWLTISLVDGLPIHPTHPPVIAGVAIRYTEIDLSLWAEGHDDNTIQKGIEAWVGVHFPAWEVKSLKCVRR